MGIIEELYGLEEKDTIKEIKKENLPLVMWGAGSSAEEVFEYISQNDIIIDDIFVDDEYYCENMELLGKRVLSYSLLRQKYNKVNVIMGNSYYEKIERLKSQEVICKVFYLFSMSYSIYDKTSISEIESNIDKYETVFNYLSDELSKNCLLAFLKTRVSGNNQYIFDVFTKEMNFFNNDIFRVGEEEVYIDVGAFDGDTIRLFLKENKGKYKHIYAIEPDSNNFNKLNTYISLNNIKKISVKEYGAWNEEGEMAFYSSESKVSSFANLNDKFIEKSNSVIKVDTLDNMFNYKDNVSLLKINYLEGVYEALQGAKNIIRKYNPKIVITVGFDCKNIRMIPILLKQINPSYRLYLRFNRGMTSALTLYGVCNK